MSKVQNVLTENVGGVAKLRKLVRKAIRMTEVFIEDELSSRGLPYKGLKYRTRLYESQLVVILFYKMGSRNIEVFNVFNVERLDERTAEVCETLGGRYEHYLVDEMAYQMVDEARFVMEVLEHDLAVEGLPLKS